MRHNTLEREASSPTGGITVSLCRLISSARATAGVTMPAHVTKPDPLLPNWQELLSSLHQAPLAVCDTPPPPGCSPTPITSVQKKRVQITCGSDTGCGEQSWVFRAVPSSGGVKVAQNFPEARSGSSDGSFPTFPGKKKGKSA